MEKPKLSKKSFALAIFSAIALTISCILFFLIWNQLSKKSIEQTSLQPIETDDEYSQDIVTDITGQTDEDSIGPYEIFEGNNKNYGALFEKTGYTINWQKGATRLSVEEEDELFKNVKQGSVYFEQDNFVYDNPSSDKRYTNCLDVAELGTPDESFRCKPYLYKLGTMSMPEQFRGDTLYLMNVQWNGLGSGFLTYYVIHSKSENSFILIEQLEGEYLQNQYEHHPLITGVITHQLSEVTPPETIKIPDQASYLKYSKHYDENENVFDRKDADKNAGGIIDVKKGIIVTYPKEDEQQFVDEETGFPIYFSNETYKVVLPNGSVHLYELIPYFFISKAPVGSEKEFYQAGYNTQIQWKNSPQHKDKKFVVGGDLSLFRCTVGVVPCTSVVDDNDWFSLENLVEIGKTDKGDSLYELKDKATNSYYKSVYDFGYEGSLSYNHQTNSDTQKYESFQKMTDTQKYESFLDDQAVFFWKDYQGRWRVYMRADYQSLAECGKPVIYLYPEKDIDVRVQVKPNGGFTVTDPEYGKDGWFVHAKSNGELFNYQNNTNYPYLFWEGFAFNYKKPEVGFVMSKKEVEKKMIDILASLGLNTKETSDFLEFWQTKLESSPYVFVSFVDQKTFDVYAPLIVTPKPDTIIRVFMDYTPLEELIYVKEPTLRTPKRNGFTVVEWGGALHR